MATNMMNAMNGMNPMGGMNPTNGMLPQAQGYQKQSGARDFFLGNKGGFVQSNNYNPQQQQAFSQILQQALSMLNPQAQREQAINHFNQQTVPGLAERFTSLGQGRTSSPAFASQLGQAGAGLETNLAALQSQYGMGLLPYGLQQQNETHFQEGNAGLFSQLLGALLKTGQAAGGAYLGNMGLSKAISELARSNGGQ